MMNKKIVMFTIAMVLLLGVTMGVTFALMTDTTEQLTNTFVAGTFGTLTLKESDNAEAELDAFYEAGQVLDGTEVTVSASEIVKVKNDDDDDVFKGYKYTLTPGIDLDKRVYVKFAPTATTANAYIYVKVIGNGWSIGTATDKDGDTPLLGKLVYKNSDNKVIMYADVNLGEGEWELDADFTDEIVFVYYDSTGIGTVENEFISKLVVVDNLTEAEVATANDANLDFQAYAAQSDGFNSAKAAFDEAF